MTIEQIKELRDGALETVRERTSSQSVLGYELEGGQETTRPWRVFGFFAHIEGEGRVVYELMFWMGRSVGLARIFKEEPLAVIYEARLTIPVALAIYESTMRFLQALEHKALRDVVSADRDSRESFPADFGDPGIVLYPLPPPVRGDLLPELLDA